MKKIIAMIPARIGSKRIAKKNLRCINGKPLIEYAVEAALGSNSFDEIYINSDGEIFAEIAEMYNIKFYKRPGTLASDSATNDEFVLDFINNIDCEFLIQLLPTSPFISANEITGFIHQMLNGKFDTVVSVTNVQIECLFEKRPVNFNKIEQTQPSQTLTPIRAYACGLMGWRSESFKQNMHKFNAAYHGGDDKIGYYELTGFSTVDIDKEEDFALAEVISKMKERPVDDPQYYQSQRNGSCSEVHVPSILKRDGIEYLEELDDANKPLANIDQILNGMPQDKSWSKRIINTENNSATIICQKPGEGNRLHYHDQWNEWWYILEGRWLWEVENEKIEVKKGDVVFIEKGKRHKITALGNQRAIRLAVSREDVAHIYPSSS